jgi:hypothetical protein
MPLIERKDVPLPAFFATGRLASAPAGAQPGKRSADALLQPSASVMPSSILIRNVLLAGALFLGAGGWPAAAISQTLKDIKEAESPLALKGRESFFLGATLRRKHLPSWALSSTPRSSRAATSQSIRCTSSTWFRS